MTDKSSEPEEPPILNVKVLADLRSFGGLREIVQEFLTEVPMRIGAIRKTTEEKRFDALALQAHALKGASGATGAVRLSRASAKLEIAARAKNEAQLDSIIYELALEIDIATKALLEVLEDEPDSAN